MPDTSNLALPQIAAAQAQKHVTHNEALVLLDALVQLAVVSRMATAPPASPTAGERYVIPASGTGSFAGRVNQIAFHDGSIWRYLMPRAGWQAYVQDEAASVIFTGTAWVALGQVVGAISQLASLGIATATDAVNKLAVRSAGALLTAPRVASGGTGDSRLTIDKESAARTGSLVFQDNFSGRAEFGLMGDDDVRLKVSADGSLWRDVFVVDRLTGQVSFPNGASGVGGSAGVLGQCRLGKTGANLVLTQFGGDKITIGNIARSIPAAGVSLAATSLVAATTYRIYAYMAGAAIALEASTAAHVTDTNGVEIKSGDSSRTLVGMARVIAGPAWQDSPGQRFVLSWFNRRPRALGREITTAYSTASNIAAELGAGVERLEFLAWADSAVDTRATLSVDAPDNGSSIAAGYFRMVVDGVAATTGDIAIYIPVASYFYIPVCLSNMAEVTEGYHFAAISWRVSSAGFTMVNLGGANGTSVLNGTIAG